MHFASDNAGPAAPQILEAVVRANSGYERSYGADRLHEAVRGRIREIFEAPEAEVHLVATGTAANSLALATLCPPWATIYCHRHSHVEEDECGGPEFFTGGAKLTLLDGTDAKISLDSLESALESAAPVGVHNVQRGALSLTNATERGAVYTPAEVAELTRAAGRHRLPCHMDGARFANALLSAGCTAAEMTWRAGIDILSFGGTKNGLLGVEAVVIFDPSRSWEFELRRKRGGHLFSKHRYLSAQMHAYLEDDLWLRLAGLANDAADRLAGGLSKIPDAEVIHPPEANMVFASLPRGLHREAFSAGAEYYLWPPNQSLEGDGKDLLEARLVCNWATKEAEVDEFLRLLSAAASSGDDRPA